MPGDDWQRFANLRAYYGFMWGHPGKKLLFMGQEFGQRANGTSTDASTGSCSITRRTSGVQRLRARPQPRSIATTPALHARDCEAEGFRWIVVDDDDQSVLAWLRFGAPGDPPVAVVCNFTPVPRATIASACRARAAGARSSTPTPRIYGGSGLGNLGGVVADATPAARLAGLGRR